MKAAIGVVLLLLALHNAECMFCYSHIPGKEGTTWVFCPSTSCYTVGESITGIDTSKRGCADKSYTEECQKAEAIIPEDDVCFCNTLLCNINGASSRTYFLPLLLLPYLIHKFI